MSRVEERFEKIFTEISASVPYSIETLDVKIVLNGGTNIVGVVFFVYRE
jgi:hypothetical protein